MHDVRAVSLAVNAVMCFFPAHSSLFSGHHIGAHSYNEEWKTAHASRKHVTPGTAVYSTQGKAYKALWLFGRVQLRMRLG